MATIKGTSGDDFLLGTEFRDRINGRGGNDKLEGLSGDDILRGGSGDDNLDGGLGKDTLIGGTGSDFYYNNSTDTIIEYCNQGFDGLTSSVSYKLGDNLEYLTLTGSSAISAKGNVLDNQIFGNDGNNFLYGGDGNDILSGGLGRDTLIGGTGDDDYRVDSTTDTITEYLNEGIDIVDSLVNYTLGDNLENLSLLNGSGTSGIGNALDNQISANNANSSLYGKAGNDYLLGGTGDDILDGGTGNDTLLGDVYAFGNDTLTGGADADIFSFYSPQAIDTITDFMYQEGDKIEVAATRFGIGQRPVRSIHVPGKRHRRCSVLSGDSVCITAARLWF